MSKSIKSMSLDKDYLLKHHLDMICSMPHIVYWLNDQCMLEGCNYNFLGMMGLEKLHDCIGMSYAKMAQSAHWSDEQTLRFLRKDKEALTSGTASFDVLEAADADMNGSMLHYSVTRIPLFDVQGLVIGLLVILINPAEGKSYTQSAIEAMQREKNNFQLDQAMVTKVLFIEDNMLAQRVTARLLEALNCSVDLAASENEAMIAFEPGKYDLIFMDLNLNDSSGYIVAKKFREIEKAANKKTHVPIIALTAYESEIVKDDCAAYEMEGVLTKPMSGDQAKQLILRYVHHQDISVRGLK